ncbi:MAG: hypothetical protein SXG53_01035 [Pseudomonadota bacterium]|nr:hypothetical protein [Pseudomonadota bacterium]
MFRWSAWMMVAAVSTWACVSQSAEPALAEPPPGPGLELMQRSCIGCHDVYMITAKRKTPEEWATIVGLMADRGAEVTPAEMQVIEDYLSQNFSTATANPTAAQ